MNKEEIISVINDISGIKVEKTKYLGGGSYGKVFKCTDNQSNTYAFKIFTVQGMAEREALSLRELGKNTAIKIPEVYFVQTKNQNTPFDCMLFEYINGKNAFNNANLLLASKKKKQEFSNAVIDSLLSIHSIKSDKFGFPDNPEYDSWIQYYKPFAERIYNEAVIKNKEGKFDKYILDVMTKAWQEFDNIFSDDVTEACLIHGDINVMNIMVDRSFRPVAFIDPLNSMYADREYDLFQLQNLTGNRFDLYNNYKSKFKVSKSCDLKCAFYSLWNEAMVYQSTGRYTKFIMNASIKNMKKQLKNCSF